MPQILIDATVEPDFPIDRVDDLRPAVEEMIRVLGLNVLKCCSYQHRGGATLMYVLSNIHLIVHSFPEESQLCFDLFADGVWPGDVAHVIEEVFNCRRVRVKAVVDH